MKDGEVEEANLSYAELDLRSRALAAELQARGLRGERVLMLYPSGLDFVVGFLGCLYAGALAVPAYMPQQRREHWQRLESIVADCDARLILGSEASLGSLREPLAESETLREIPTLASDLVDVALAEHWVDPGIDSAYIAFLQYTSGSTGSPKGVMVSHGNLLHNQWLMREAFGHHRDSVLVSWLPLFHDMGLIGNVLHTLYLGARCVLMSPVAFLQSPVRWLKAISNYRAHSSFAPNFAYELCVRRVGEEQRAELDLSSWTFALNGAEPVRAETLRKFSEAFAGYGFAANACYPGYGLAECTLFAAGGARFGGWIERKVDATALSVGRAEAAASDAAVLTAVSSGRQWHDLDIRIVDPETGAACADGAVGEIWLSGPSVAQGYWRKPEATEATFRARIVGDDSQAWLRTGDLGFRHDDAFFITGRLKEVVIVRGRNYYPQDIEHTVQQAVHGLRPDGGAAFSVDLDGDEQLVVVQEVERTAMRGFDVDAAAQAVRAAIAEVHEIPLRAVVFIRPATLPKTSSGKIQRRECRQRFVDGALTEIGRGQWLVRESALSASAFDGEALRALPEQERQACLLGDIRGWLSARLGVAETAIDPQAPLLGLGIDSVRIVEFQHLLEQRLAVEIALTELLQAGSLQALATALSERIGARAAGSEHSTHGVVGFFEPQAEDDAPEEPSLNQRALWLQHQLSRGSGAYTIALPLRIRQPLDASALSRAIELAVARHEQLRIVFAEVDGAPRMRAQASNLEILSTIDASDDSEAALRERIAASAHRDLDIERGPMFVAELYRRDDEAVLLLKAHHLVVDLWSMQLLLRDIVDIYTALSTASDGLDVLPAPGDYRRYAAWQRTWLRSPAAAAAEDYWRTRLAALPPPLALSAARRPAAHTHAGAALDVTVPPACRDALAALAHRSGATLYSALLAAYQVLLCRYSGEDAVCVGTPVADRERSDFGSTIGYFVNPLPLIGAIDDNPAFDTYLARTRDAVFAALAHRHYPLVRMIEAAGVARDHAAAPLFQTLFAYQSTHILEGFAPFVLGAEGGRLARGALTLETYPLPVQRALMELSLTVVDTEHGLASRFEYNTELFDTATVARLAEGWLTLLDAIAANPSTPVWQLDAVGATELQRLAAHRRTERDFAETNLRALAPADATFDAVSAAHDARDYLPQIVARQAQRTPDAVALIDGQTALSYAQFQRRVDRLTLRLQAAGIGPESRVVVAMPRSVEMVIALHAVMNAGAAYVPVDPNLPAIRIGHIFDSAQPGLSIVAADSAVALPNDAACLRLDPALWAGIDDASASQPRPAPVALRDDSAAYVIYTSGSTGLPKGVINTHAGIRNRLLWMQAAYPLGADDRVVQKTPFGFDVSVWEFFWPLMFGAGLVVAKPEGHRDPAYLHALIAEHKITTAHFVPSMLGQFLDHASVQPAAADGAPALPSLRRVICSGEELPLAMQRDFFQRYPGVELHNLYGPTEAAVDVSAWACLPEQSSGPVPIGWPIANTRLYVLDRMLQPVATGVPGELFIAGVNLARGYAARPDLTAERFLPDPFGPAGSRMYRTGDLARLREDGAIEYLGRTDFQIKLRGLRIELGEIESAILGEGLAREAVVVAREFGADRRLVAYIAGGDAAVYAQQPARFAEALRARLPDYMVPAHVVALEALPLSANGKIDRKALPAPALLEERDAWQAPEGAVETELAAVWADLLAHPRVGRDSHFFALGGHSLLAMRLGARVRARFGVELGLAQVFAAPTLREQAAAIEHRTAFGAHVTATAAPLAPRPLVEGEAIPLSRAQQRLWLLERLDPGNPVYNVPIAIDLHGPTDAAALNAALRAICAEHTVLRSVFFDVDGVGMQRCMPVPASALVTTDLRGLPAAEREARVTEAVEAAATHGFDLGVSAFRAQLLIADDAQAVLVLNLHHIVSDGRSVELLLDALWTHYRAIVAGRDLASNAADAANTATPRWQYADYALWDSEAREAQASARQLAFWAERLAGLDPLSTLPTDRPRPPSRRFQGASLPFALSSALSARIAAQCRRCGVTPGTFLLAAFQYVLARHAGKRDIAIGMPVSTRDRDEWQPLLGFFVNTVAIRSRFDHTDAFSALLARAADAVAQALAHQDVFFEEVVEHLQPERSASHNPLVQVMFSYQDAPLADWQDGALRWKRRAYDSRVAKFDLTAVLESGAEGIGGYVEYDTALYDAATIASVIAHYREVLAALAESVERPLAELPWLSKPELARLLAHFDRSATEYPPLSVHALFAQCAARHAQAPALRADGVDWSYAELERRANAAAAVLKRHGVGPGQRVAVCMARTPAMIVALLAILKNGAAYVPIDPQQPMVRTQAILRDAGIARLICAPSLLGNFAGDSAFASVQPIDGEALAEAARSNTARSETATSDVVGALPWRDAETPADAPAYVIYTSGSTGLPKGVVVPHRGIARLLFGVDQYTLGPQRRILHAASIAFDASTFEVWGALLHGGVCVLSPEAVPTPDGLRRAIAEDGVDTLWLTSSLFNAIAETDAGCFAGLSQLLVGGDRVSPRHVALAQAAAPGVAVINGYGPTETTTFACCHRIAVPVDTAREVPIGTPLGNTALYVLDAGLQWVPAGVAGELFIGGAGVAQGYLGAPEATAANFVPDPFSPVPGARMYRTGDTVRHFADGTLEFLGRRDHQVKIRGFRIELAEIEARLQASTQLRDAAVKVQGDGADKRLVAYAVAETPDCDPIAVLAGLRASLPDYMVPARLLLLDRLPLNANGKLDRAALPEATFESDARDYVAPRDALESRLAELWQQALGVARVGLHDDFFALGGHSLMAMKVAAAWGRFDDRELPVRALFEHPTVGALAAHLRERASAAQHARKPAPVARSKYAALSFSQQRLWFLEQMEGPSPLYSMASALRIEGQLDLDLFERALNKLVERHESLRTRFVLVDELPAQEVLDRAELRIGRIDYAALDAAAAESLVQRVIATEAATPFDLGEAPLMRATAIRIGAQSHVLLFNMHHIVSDGWSVDVLIRELSQLYSAGATSRDDAAALAPLPLQYVDFACWQRELLQTGHYDSQLDYWRARLADAPPLLELPTDRPRPAVQDPRGERLPLELPPALTAAVRRLAREHGASVFMTLLAAYSALLARHSGQSDIAVGAPIANRTHPEFAGLIGFFANTIVLRSHVNAETSFRELLRATRDCVTEAQSHQDVPFEQLVEDLNPVRSPSHSPLFQAMFAYENVTQARWRLGELGVEPVDVDTGYVKFDVLLSLRDDGERIVGAMEYRSALFDRSTVQRWCGHLLSLLAAAAADPDRPVRSHALLSDDERLDVLQRLNRTAPVPAPAHCVHELFERQAQRTPDATAVLHGTQAWTYRELDARAEAIAAAMRRSGVGRGAQVAVYLERHPDLVATLLATMKAGAAYVPLDPKYPAARNADIIADTLPTAIATQRGLRAEIADRAASVGAHVLEIDAIARDAEAAGVAESTNAANERTPATLSDPAYFIYTSGSTGRPKGIVISHRSAATMLAWADREFDAEELAVTLASTSICFDISIFELFLPLAKGGTLLLVDDALALAHAPLRDRVTLINTVPSAMTALLETAELPSALRTVNLAGEPLTRRLADAVYAQTSATKLYNLYGPSEDTTYSTWCLVPRDSAEKPTIGRPIANTQAYVLDAFGQPVPLGIAGELYLAGDGLADGYWNRPELTAAAFVANPFDPAPGARMYRTGDWVRMRADGELEYIGRIDHQVKLNGFRIELGEIEHRMLRCPGVAMACVLVRKDQAGFDRLVGYVSSEGGERVADAATTTATIRRELERQLPHFMVPSAIVALERMPLSPNGKIDRRALPEPPAWGGEQSEYRAPRTDTERRVASIWGDLLQRPRIGVDDNFFDIGGHSLLAAQISLRVKREFEVDLPVRHVFQSATVAALAEEIDNRRWLQRSASSQQPADAFEEGTI